MAPNIGLSYSSQPGELVAPFGYGWSLATPYIERINRYGLDKLYSTSTVNVFYSSLSGELATTTSTSTFAAKIDNGAFMKYTYANNSWCAIDKASTSYRFGTTTAGRRDDPNDSTRIFKWTIQEIRDTNDNYVTFEYTNDSGDVYPSKIEYTYSTTSPGILEVEYLLETRPDVATSTRTGFAVVAKQRVYEIRAKVNGTWTRKYAISYGTGTNQSRSLISSITESGETENGAITVARPSTTFLYQASTTSCRLKE